MKNATRLSTLIVLLLLWICFANCTHKAKITTGPIDSIIGSYTGTYHYRYYGYGSGTTYNYIDTSYVITVTLLKVSPDSFMVVYPPNGLAPFAAIYLVGPIKYSSTNQYYENFFFYPSNDSFYAKIDYVDGGQYRRYWFQTFKGKK